jgi:ATP-dependent Clp protease, protease subunit
MNLLKTVLIGLITGGLTGIVVYRLTSTTPVVEQLTTPSVKELPTGNTVPELKSVKVRKIEVLPEQVIMFNAQVSFNSVQATIDQLEALSARGIKEVYIVLDSPGGSVIDGATLISYMKSSDMKINTLCQGVCASMAAQIHQVGKVRLMTEKSILMFHPASSGVRGTLEEMISQLNTIKLYVDRLDAEVAARAGIKYEDFKKLVVSELWIEGVDAIDMGLTDGLAFIFVKQSFGSEVVFNLRQKLGETKVNDVKGVRDLK